MPNEQESQSQRRQWTGEAHSLLGIETDSHPSRERIRYNCPEACQNNCPWLRLWGLAFLYCSGSQSVVLRQDVSVLPRKLLESQVLGLHLWTYWIRKSEGEAQQPAFNTWFRCTLKFGNHCCSCFFVRLPDTQWEEVSCLPAIRLRRKRFFCINLALRLLLIL